jgi:hypothetical protein
MDPRVVSEAGSAAAKALRPTPREGPDAEGVELLSSQQAHVDQAAAAPEIDEQAVAAARELIRTGQLDTPDAIRRAADAILRFGP